MCILYNINETVIVLIHTSVHWIVTMKIQEIVTVVVPHVAIAIFLIKFCESLIKIYWEMGYI